MRKVWRKLSGMFVKDQIIGRNYKVIARLGEGGMGQVYRALDVNLGREVAIKFLLPEIAKEEEIVRRFLNEGRILATINHPAVISVYASDVEETSGIPFLVMEFVDGMSLDKYQDSLRQNPSELLNHFIHLMGGIHACHQKGIIHRDLKPENLLINSNNQLKIVDFGIAKSASRSTKTGIVLGTPHYMSPEQCLGKQDITPKADVYAAGIMLFEIFTGSLPFKTEGHVDDPALSIALMHLNQAPDFTELEKSSTGKAFKHLISQMIAKKPEDRPEVPKIISELRNILGELDFSEQPTIAKEAIRPANEKIIGEIYEIQSELGSGGMGKVFKALDTALNRTVAIKVLHESTTRDSSLVERFIQEGQVLATVVHRNVMSIYASSRDKRTGRPFLVMEYIEGKPLSKVKQALESDRKKAVPIMLQLAEGLAACHEKGIIHRDLKPGNIIITNTGLVKILDFGIAKTSANLTKTGMTVGTPEYMSPEQCTGSRNISVKSDIYSLGIIFWELIFGIVPFKADANTNPELSIALKHIEATLPAQVAIPDMSLVKIIGMVRRMLDKSPEARPDIEQIINTLEEFIDEHLPEEPEARNSGRRSSRRSTSSISGLVQSASTGSESSKRTTLIIILIALLLGAGTAAWKFELFKGKERIDYQKEINLSINSADFNRARQLLIDFEATEEGKSQASYIKVELSKAMILKAEESAAALDYQKAINLYAQAIVLDPANPRAALNLSKLQQNFQKTEELKQRVEELKIRATVLLAGIEPASGTTELHECIKELFENGLATQAADISARWQTKFIAAASPLINGQPEKALQYLDELQKFFPEFKEVEELAAQARKKRDALKDELANADRLNSLKTALNAAIDDYTVSQNRELIIKQIDRVAELGEQNESAALKRKLAGKIAMEAEKLIVNDPKQALRLFENASQIFPDLEGLATKMRLASESLATIQSSEEIKVARENLIKEIESRIDEITPPAEITLILSKLEELSGHKRSARRVNALKDKLFEKYFSAVALEIDRSPETAKRILAYCEKLRPDAPGLKELGANIDEKIQVETARKKAAKDKARMARLETAKNAIYTGIKKDPIPQDLEKLHAEVSALSRDYPESDAGEKLMVHLKNRCREEISSMLNSGSDKTRETLEKARLLFADDSQMLEFVEQSSQKLIEKAQIKEKKKLIEKPLKEIEAFIKNPQIENTESVKENLKQIEAVSENESKKLSSKILASLQKKFDSSENPEQAKANFSLIAAIDVSLKDKTEDELEKLARKKATQTAKQIGEIKTVDDLKKLDEKLKVFDTWDRQLEKTQTLEKLKSVFLELASGKIDQEPEEAFEILVSLQKVEGLENDQQIKTQIDSIKKTIDSGKTDGELKNNLATAESIFSSGEISDKTDELFKIIDYLKKISPADADKIKNRTVEKLLTQVENSINDQHFNEAEKIIILVKQFSPENEKAQKFQVAITEARKASEKPKEFLVGLTGTHRTINEAISAAPEGMKIVIQPGTYNEKVVLNKNVSLVGESASRCSITFANQPTIIIDGNASISNLTLTNTSSSPQPTIHILKGNAEISGCIISNSSPAKPPDYLGSILISGGSPKISKNQLVSSKTMGITISGGNPVVSANSVTGCSLYGIWINGSGIAKISGNTIKNNGKSGVGIKNSANPDFTGNTIEGNGENGLLIYGNAKGRYENNQLNGNTLSGIEIWDAQPESIKNNNFSGNRRDGIFVRGDKAVARIGSNQMAPGQTVNNSGGKIIDL